MKQGFNTNPCKTRKTKDSAIDKEDHFKVLPTAVLDLVPGLHQLVVT